MADFSVTLTIPDDKVSELLDALRYVWADDTLTGMEIRDRFKTVSENYLREQYLRYKRYQATQGITDDLEVS